MCVGNRGGSDYWNKGVIAMWSHLIVWDYFDVVTMKRMRMEHHHGPVDGEFGTTNSTVDDCSTPSQWRDAVRRAWRRQGKFQLIQLARIWDFWDWLVAKLEPFAGYGSAGMNKRASEFDMFEGYKVHVIELRGSVEEGVRVVRFFYKYDMNEVKWHGGFVVLRADKAATVDSRPSEVPPKQPDEWKQPDIKLAYDKWLDRPTHGAPRDPAIAQEMTEFWKHIPKLPTVDDRPALEWCQPFAAARQPDYEALAHPRSAQDWAPPEGGEIVTHAQHTAADRKALAEAARASEAPVSGDASHRIKKGEFVFLDWEGEDAGYKCPFALAEVTGVTGDGKSADSALEVRYWNAPKYNNQYKPYDKAVSR